MSTLNASSACISLYMLAGALGIMVIVITTAAAAKQHLMSNYYMLDTGLNGLSHLILKQLYEEGASSILIL